MIAVLALAVLIPLSPARCGQEEPSRVKAELLAEQASSRPGGKITLGIRLKMADGWHTYWRNPGDSGMATTVKWTLPRGFEAGELRWPYPRRFRSKTSNTFGYDDEAMLLADLSAPTPISGAAQVRAKVSWLECRKICVPGEADLSLTLPEPDPAKKAAHAAAIAAARRRIPGTLADEAFAGWKIRAERFDDRVVIVVNQPIEKEGLSLDFFPEDDGVIGDILIMGGQEPYVTAAGSTRSRNAWIAFKPSRAPGADKAARLDGVLVFGGRHRAAQVSLPIKNRSRRKP